MNEFKIEILYILHYRTEDRKKRPPRWPLYIESNGRCYHLMLRSGSSVDVYVRPDTTFRFASESGLSLHPNGSIMYNGHDVFNPQSEHVVGEPLWDLPTAPVLILPPNAEVTLVTSAVSRELRNTIRENPSLGIADYSAELLRKLQVAKALTKEQVTKEQDVVRERSQSQDRAYSFHVGQRVWLAVPYRAAAADKPQNTKFQFKWAGPMRVVTRFKDQYDLVETLPNSGIMTHLATSGRMRPYVNRIPADSAEDAALLANDDYKAELERWKIATVYRRRPSGMQIASGVNPELRRRFEDDFDDELEREDPEYEIEKIITHGFRDEDHCYTYKVHYKGYSAKFDDWHLESDLPRALVAEYWKTLEEHKPTKHISHELTMRRQYLKDKGKRTKRAT